MKNIKLITLFFGLLVFLGCDEEEYVDYTAPDELSDVSWVIGLENGRVSRLAQFNINVNTQIPFFNLAQGAVSKEWTIEDGNNYLNVGFKSNDSIFDDYIKNDVGLTITDPKAFVLFNNSGQNIVRLVNKFNEPTEPNITGNDADNIIVATYEENGLYVVDTEFIFDVYADMLPAFSVSQNGNELINVTAEDMPDIADESTWPVVEVEAATALTFKDNTTIGRPNRATWVIPDGVPTQPSTASSESAEIKFYKLGTVNAGTFRSVRFPDTDQPILPRKTVEKIIPLKVKVIQSSQPFVFDGALIENENEVIQFRVNGEITPFAGQEGLFTVNVKNTTSGFDQNIAVKTARVKEEDATFIELVLAEPIYNSDEVSVSYNGTSLISADDRILEPFGPEIVQMHFGNNVLANKDWAGFEQEHPGAARAKAQDFWVGGKNGNFGDLVWERVSNVKFSGNSSMRYKAPASNPIPVNFNLFGFGISKPSGVPAGTYRVIYWVFIDPATTLSAFRMDFGNAGKNEDIYVMPPVDISQAPKGQWTRVSSEVVFTNDLPAGYRTHLRFVAGDNPGISGAQLMYFDDLSLIEIEVRP